ncbi:cyclophane-forming radical SAM/SPASM peptide maturase GrrM/OscB [Tunturibacter gelidoferens]|uniref:Cyclophane-forming radical SAM/SPASM peptide maturase GrrM/OscB n=1 Tax=Tunturiibacter gelidiferens TaxID=3069689 RepID=A0AAU7Z7K5_9BACT
MQPTPFCNINCDYCYLADRSNRSRMSIADAISLVRHVVSSGLVGDSLSIVWHAGEPLTLPASYYWDIFAGVANAHPEIHFKHSFQTNGMLINDEWCRLFRQWNVNVGVSIDGPAWIHDSHRKDRAGRGTHDRVMAGARVLRANDIPFHVISVLSANSLDHADEIFAFFMAMDVDRIGFNIEELESAHTDSSISSRHLSQVQTFFEVLANCRQKEGKRIHIREFDNALSAIAGCELNPENSGDLMNNQTEPLAILTVAWDGSFTTFSPELIDAKSRDHASFIFGNILQGDLEDLMENPKFVAIAAEVEAGRKLCSNSCQYFPLCGGGAPSNKYFENGRFDSTETVYCQSVIQIPIRVVLGGLERELGIVHGSPDPLCAVNGSL